ncbi:MAG: 3-deoxy-D-manno-octulosonic acid transferase [Planctomycetes bacterium]|nr:3-deoxy-D-manno-octulosonic acid transferase [Planctomycetota bacterium]
MPLFFAWLLNSAYLMLLLLASPWLAWSAFKHGKYREGFSEKLLGRVTPRTSDRPCVWLHAVSVGEVNLLETTLAELKSRHPDWDLVISTTTKAGYDLASRKYSPDYSVFYCPLDFSWAATTAMRRVRPNLLVLAELELWPNLIRAAKQHGAKVAIINGRMGDKSFRGYHRFRWLVRPILRQIDVIAAQNEEIAERFKSCGAIQSTVTTTGSLKFEGAQTDRQNEKTRSLQALAGMADSDIVFLAGSTQEPEEAYALGIFQTLAAEYPQLRLVIVPRHPQRFEEVARLLNESGTDWQRRSKLTPATHSSKANNHDATNNSNATNSRDATHRRKKRVLLVDTIGELGAWWGTATIGFVGGTFGSRGGQNMLEPAAYGVATCFGPNTWNFRDIVAQLRSVDGAKIVQDRHALEQFVRQSLLDPNSAKQLGARAQQLVLTQQGATKRTIDLLEPLVTTKRKVTQPRNAA